MSDVNFNHLALAPYTNKEPTAKPPSSDTSSIQIRLTPIIKPIIDHSLKVQLSDYNHFKQYGMGDIVVLVGTSTAGKSSIIQALKKMETNRLEDGGDIRGLALNLKLLTKYHPQDIALLEKVIRHPLDVPNAVFSPERLWKEGITPEEKEQAEEAIKNINNTISDTEQADANQQFKVAEASMFDDAFEQSRSGKNIILDALNIDVLAQQVINRNFTGPLRVILTYCPFQQLSDRMAIRNEKAIASGEISNQRVGEFPLTQFGEIYGKSQKPLEELTREQVTKIFDKNFDQGIAHALQEGRLSSVDQQKIDADKDRLRTNLLDNLGFTEGVNKVAIGPKNASFYTGIIDSSQSLPEQSAASIHQGTYQRYNLEK